MTAPIAILGATSQIARDFILSASRRFSPDLRLYARRPDAALTFLQGNNLAKSYPVRSLSAFGKEQYSAVINFVGVGDPAKARAMGADIFSATRDIDLRVLQYLENCSDTIYIFMSSGAAYGSNFFQPADASRAASVPLNDFLPQDYYSVAKLYAEALHRAASDKTIIDIRIFNYISRTLDLGTRFLISDMANAILNNTPFQTDDVEIVRDYQHPNDFCHLIECCLRAPKGTNTPIDAYSRGPIGKRELIKLMTDAFGMRCEIIQSADSVNATGKKPNYYSTNKRAASLGYNPCYSSQSGIGEEMRAILAQQRTLRSI